jgi:hypothetical protein
MWRSPHNENPTLTLPKTSGRGPENHPKRKKPTLVREVGTGVESLDQKPSFPDGMGCVVVSQDLRRHLRIDPKCGGDSRIASTFRFEWERLRQSCHHFCEETRLSCP